MLFENSPALVLGALVGVGQPPTPSQAVEAPLLPQTVCLSNACDDPTPSSSLLEAQVARFGPLGVLGVGNPTSDQIVAALREAWNVPWTSHMSVAETAGAAERMRAYVNLQPGEQLVLREWPGDPSQSMIMRLSADGKPQAMMNTGPIR